MKPQKQPLLEPLIPKWKLCLPILGLILLSPISLNCKVSKKKQLVCIFLYMMPCKITSLLGAFVQNIPR